MCLGGRGVWCICTYALPAAEVPRLGRHPEDRGYIPRLRWGNRTVEAHCHHNHNGASSDDLQTVVHMHVYICKHHSSGGLWRRQRFFHRDLYSTYSSYDTYFAEIIIGTCQP